MKNKLFKFESCRRVMVVFVSIILAFGLIPVRLFIIRDSGYESAAKATNRQTVTLSTSRGIIYDRKMRRLTSDTISTISAVKPSADSLRALKETLSPEQFDVVSDELSQGKPLVLKIGNTTFCKDILTTPIYNRYNNSRLASHVIGYLGDGGTTGVSGIERSYDSLLKKYGGTLKAGFSADARGKLLSGAEIEIINENYNSGGGVILTIDREYQQAVEKAMDESVLAKGAAVMVEVKTGAIVAMASRPNFDAENVAQYLDDENSSLFNRAVGSYPVGSVFKPLVAAVALEQGFDPATKMYCSGKTKSGGVEFGCLKEHGSVNLPGALAYSCNCYFVGLMKSIDVTGVLDMASSLGIGEELTLAEGITAYSGSLPSFAELDSAAARANLSFGQGKLTATPVQIASLYAAIAAGGDYHTPYLVEAVQDGNGNKKQVHIDKPPYKLFSKKTADLLNTFLELSVREGTCKAAAVEGIKVSGKTATAQSGEFVDGKERLVSWFAGFYPSEAPEYVLVVMCENGASGSEDCAPVFAKAVGAITKGE